MNDNNQILCIYMYFIYRLCTSFVYNFFVHIQVSRKIRTKLIVRVNEADEKSLCKIIGAQKFVSFSNIPAILDTVMNIFETVCDCITV